MALSNETLTIIGFLLGPIGRTLYDYLWALRDNPEDFDRRYIVTMILSIAISIIVGIFFLPGILSNLPEGTWAYILASSFAQGFMLNHIINKPVDEMRDNE